MFERISSLDCQMNGISSDTEWKWNFVLEEMGKKFETSYTVSNERLIKAGAMIWTVLRPLTMPQSVRPKEDKEDKDTSTSH